eukprot:11669698-Karenia_brevis.AAC.1
MSSSARRTCPEDLKLESVLPMHFPPPPADLPLGLLRRTVKKGRCHMVSKGLRSRAIAWLWTE